ncbi:MAG: Na/Pi cotransporter family protein [Lachnospiraceae bacterium]|nr:Na/Pi cotransporter family protein [Lachnospiraceae bacterium]
MPIENIIQLIGGVGMFLYGMSMLSGSLERIAGSRLENTLAKLTDNKFKALGLGVFVTCAIQSSAATSVMVLGFLNAGIMNLLQAVPVIMGANIGTTITAQILRLNDLSGGIVQYLNPSKLAPIFIALGAGISLVNKKTKARNASSLIIGFGILFVGMSTMSTALDPLKQSESFRSFLLVLKNPALGVVVGILITAVLQSSSAAVGMLQSMAPTGLLAWSTAIPILIGMNIGKCVTVVLAGLGTNKKAKRAVLIDVINNSIGAVVFIAVIYTIQAVHGFAFWDDNLSSGQIANFHTIFNLVTGCLVFPIYPKLIQYSGKIIKDGEGSKMEKELALLDDLFLKTPALALEQCKAVAVAMGETALENFNISCDLVEEYDEKKREILDENERFLDKSETVLGEYIIKITAKDLNKQQTRFATSIMHTLGDYERIGDYSDNIADVGAYNHSQGLRFSDEGKAELSYLFDAVRNIIEMTNESFLSDNETVASRIEPLEETIDDLVELLKNRHIDRLQHGKCNVEKGISFIELLTNMERISDHCSNIALHITKNKTSTDEVFDPHKILGTLHEGPTEEYRALYAYYVNRYCEPVSKMRIDTM